MASDRYDVRDCQIRPGEDGYIPSQASGHGPSCNAEGTDYGVPICPRVAKFGWLKQDAETLRKLDGTA